MSDIKNKPPRIAKEGISVGAIFAVPYFIFMLFIFTSPKYHNLMLTIINTLAPNPPDWLSATFNKDRVVGNTIFIFLSGFFIGIMGHNEDYELIVKNK
jgi:hypothetical protein